MVNPGLKSKFKCLITLFTNLRVIGLTEVNQFGHEGLADHYIIGF